MVKAKTAIVIVILALLQVSWTTTAGRSSGLDGVQEGNSHFGPITAKDSRYNGVQAVMMVNGFQKVKNSGGTAACDGRFHSADEFIVALPSGWYAGGKMCHKTIRITSADTGRTVRAQVVDKYQCINNCKNNIVHSSPAVWKKLGLHTEASKVHITWSDA